MHRKILVLSFISLTALFNGCSNGINRKITRGVYYWKTNFTLNKNELGWIKENNIKKIYLKVFDVDWNPDARQPVPEGEISAGSKVPEETEIIPTVFLTNRTLININDSLIAELADNIFKKIIYKLKDFDLKPLKEIQMDCDWTQGTKERYFHLINALKKLADAENISITATIRLHQVKYFMKTGVPPVKRGMLMFYNMSDVSDINTRNSIYDKNIAKKYLVNFDKYPVPLDVVLPAFSWGALFKNKKLSGLINDISEDELSAGDKYKSLGSGYYQAVKSNYLRSYFIGEKNIIRLEEITPQETISAADLVSRYLKKDSIVVSIYHLSSVITEGYGKEVWENITSPFN